MPEYEGALVDFDVGTRVAIDYLCSYAPSLIVPVNIDTGHVTEPCEAALQEIEAVSRVAVDYVNSWSGVLVQIESTLFYHVRPDYISTYAGVLVPVLYGLPASEFGYIRTVYMTHHGEPVPFLNTVLAADLYTGLLTNSIGKGPTVLQPLTYIAHGRRSTDEFESDEIDMSGLVPLEVEIPVRRLASAKLNKKKMR